MHIQPREIACSHPVCGCGIQEPPNFLTESQCQAIRFRVVTWRATDPDIESFTEALLGGELDTAVWDNVFWKNIKTENFLEQDFSGFQGLWIAWWHWAKTSAIDCSMAFISGLKRGYRCHLGGVVTSNSTEQLQSWCGGSGGVVMLLLCWALLSSQHKVPEFSFFGGFWAFYKSRVIWERQIMLETGCIQGLYLTTLPRDNWVMGK